MAAMDLKDAGVVVTGAGSGIGAALARRFAAEGARLVVNDLDSAAAARVAAEVGGLAVPGDAGAEESVAALVAAARAHLGEIDLSCANAGIEPGGGEHTPEEVWEQVWQVNVMGHVRAARHLIGPWLERGRGHFLATVSAAGLLTHLESASYSVSKHGALAFSEWLSATHGDKGLTVQVLCPLGVLSFGFHGFCGAVCGRPSPTHQYRRRTKPSRVSWPPLPKRMLRLLLST